MGTSNQNLRGSHGDRRRVYHVAWVHDVILRAGDMRNDVCSGTGFVELLFLTFSDRFPWTGHFGLNMVTWEIHAPPLQTDRHTERDGQSEWNFPVPVIFMSFPIEDFSMKCP